MILLRLFVKVFVIVFRNMVSRLTRIHTGISGIPVVHNAREVLTSLYKRTLEEVAFRYSSTYRKYFLVPKNL